jgi:hypothetical protein
MRFAVVAKAAVGVAVGVAGLAVAMVAIPYYQAPADAEPHAAWAKAARRSST